jgi:hypothetical protein
MTETYEERLRKRVGQVRMLGEAICSAIEHEIQKIGFKHPETLTAQFDQAEFELTSDPYDGQDSLKGIWFNPQRHTIGSVLFYADGTFYAEYDVVRPHPTDRRWFVEAITVWGRGSTLKTEARLLPNLT